MQSLIFRKNKPQSIYEELCDPKNYHKILEKKYFLYIKDPNFFLYARECNSTQKLSQKIAEELRNKTYMPGGVRPHNTISKKGKKRKVYILQSKDQIVMNVLKNVLTSYCSKDDLKPIYSNIPNKSYFQACKLLSQYIKRCHDNRKLDLYLFQMDVQQYFDTIPVNNGSVAWSQLQTLLQTDQSSKEDLDYVWMLLDLALRPPIILKNGSVCQNIIGVPTGSPFIGFQSNLYLMPIDRYLSQIEGGIYIRYCDDLIFAHPHPQVVKKAIEEFDRIASQLRLSRHPKKTKLIYLTHCGKASTQFPEFVGASSLTFLGHHILGDGSVGAGWSDVKQLFLNMRRRFKTTLKHLEKELPTESLKVSDKEDTRWRTRLHYLVKAANSILAKDSFTTIPIVNVILKKSSDRRQLKFIDHQVLVFLSQYALGEKSVKALRKLPCKKILALENVTSLERRKNREASIWKGDDVHESIFSSSSKPKQRR